MNPESENKNLLDGQAYYESAIILTDMYDKRFVDMMTDDFRTSVVERDYFVDEFQDLELMGWATFCKRMREAGQEEWLAKIEALDEEVLLRVISKKLIDAKNKEEADGALKTLQGLLSRKKAKDDFADAGSAGGSGSTVLNVFVVGEKGRGEDDTPNNFISAEIAERSGASKKGGAK